MKKTPTMSSRSRMRERDLLLFVFNKKQQMVRFAPSKVNQPVIPRSVATRNLLLREDHKKQIPLPHAGSE